jgi:hypothetical protein
MAKKRANPLKGLSINDLLDIDPDTLQHMNRSEMRQVVQRLSDAANKRLRRLENAGYKRGRLEGEGTIAGTKKFSTMGKSVGQLHREYGRLRDFLESPTSTLRGRRKVEKRARESYENFKREIDESRAKATEQVQEQETEYVYDDPFEDIPIPEPATYDYVLRDEAQVLSDMFRLWEVLKGEGAFRGTGIDDSNVQQQYVRAMIEANLYLNNEDILDDMREDLEQRYTKYESSNFHGRVSI